MDETVGSGSSNLDQANIFYGVGNLDSVARHVDDDVVLAKPEADHARQVGKLVAVLVPDLRYVVEVLVRLPKVAVVNREIRPGVSAKWRLLRLGGGASVQRGLIEILSLDASHEA